MEAFGGEDLALLLALGAQDRRLALAVGAHHGGAAFTLGGHLLVHRLDEIGRGFDFAQFDAAHLDAPGLGGAVEDGEELGVDAFARGQRRVELKLADHGADIGHRQGGERLGHRLDLIGRLLRLHDAEINHPIDGDGGVVLGDDGLLGDVLDLFLDVQFAPDPIHIGDDEVQPGMEQAGEGAEALDRPHLALRHRFGAGEHRDHDEHQHHDPENTETADHADPPALGATTEVCLPPIASSLENQISPPHLAALTLGRRIRDRRLRDRARPVEFAVP